MNTDTTTLNDLVTFARLEIQAGDIEPWAAVLAHLHTTGDLDAEQAAWAVKLYNAYDDIGSAWRVRERFPEPAAWAAASPTARSYASTLPISRERRNLLGGRIEKHLDSYVARLDGQPQIGWLGEALPVGTAPEIAFGSLMTWMRRTWGTGRQSAFEWAEFAGKVLGLPVAAPDACLWESSGPRESLQRLYGNPNPDPAWLNARAADCRDHLAAHGAPMPWWDFETVICDFNVMRKGRYYPGKHIAMIREEIESLDEPHRGPLRAALNAAVPPPWNTIPPGADKALGRAYRDTGTITTPVQGATP